MIHIIKRALLSVYRRLGKSVLLFLIVFLLGNLMVGSFAIGKSTDLVKDDIKRGLGAIITVHADEEMFSDLIYGTREYNLEGIPEVLEIISTDERINYEDVMYHYIMNSRNLAMTNQVFSYLISEIDPINIIGIYGVNLSNFSELREKNIVLTEGRTFTEEEIENGEHVIILHEDYRGVPAVCESIIENLNRFECRRTEEEIHVGDTITFLRVGSVFRPVSSDGEGVTDLYYEEEVEYEVIGIYSNREELKENNFWPQDIMNGVTYTTIASPASFIPTRALFEEEAINEKKTDQLKEEFFDLQIVSDFSYLDSVYIKLNSPDVLESFTEDLNQLFIDHGYDHITIHTSNDAYEIVAGPIESLSMISSIIVWASCGAAIIILIFVVMLFLKERKHEIGIYLSLGERKWKIMLQIVLEVYLVGILAFGASVISGGHFGDVVASKIMQVQTQFQTENNLSQYNSVNPDNMQIVGSESLDIRIDTDVVVIILGIGSLILIISTIIPLQRVLKLKVKDTFM